MLMLYFSIFIDSFLLLEALESALTAEPLTLLSSSGIIIGTVKGDFKITHTWIIIFLLANTWIVSGSTRPFVSGRSKVRRLKNEMSRENNIFASKLHLIPLLKCEVLHAPAKNGSDPKDKCRYQWVERTLQVAIICETF